MEKRRTSSASAWALTLCAACAMVVPDAARPQPADDGRAGRTPGAPGEEAATPAAEPTPARAFWIRPRAAVQETYTDNVLLTAQNRRSDWITRGTLGLQAGVDGDRTTAKLDGQASYDAYARNDKLSGWTLSGGGDGSFGLVKGLLTLDAAGTIASTYSSTFNAAATDRSGTRNRLQVATYNVGPKLSTDLGGAVDLVAAARYSQIFYWARRTSEIVELPADDSLVQLIARADSGARHSGYQLLTTAEYLKDTRGYLSTDVVESVFLRATPRLRVVARAGFQRVRQQQITRINSALLSAGFEFTPNDRSKIVVEGGRRYGRGSWAAQADLHVSPRIALAADYSEVVEPDQIYVAKSLGAFVEHVAEVPAPVVPTITSAVTPAVTPAVTSAGYAFGPNLYNQVSLNKAAEGKAAYDDGIQSLVLSASWSDRKFLATNAHDRTLTGSVAYNRALRPDLSAGLNLNYAHTYASPVFGKSRTWVGAAVVSYRMNSTMDLRAKYQISDAQMSRGGLRVVEHAATLALTKTF
jgi:uncharacterized protein (PEP-CTERM system associated)